MLLYSMHNSVKTDKMDKRLPETVKYYNTTKFGVDVIDQMTKNFLFQLVEELWIAYIDEIYNI